VNADFFAPGGTLDPIPISDGELYYQAGFPLGASADDILAELIAGISWRSERITLWGKTVLQPRLTAWYGDHDAHYSYSGICLAPLPWTDRLSDIKRRIETATGAPFNSVLLNYYRDQNDSMGFHSDDEPELGPQPVIASLSLGVQRSFILKHKKNKTLKPLRLNLASGSLLLMKGDTQHNWRHGIARETRACGPRINLTFRQIR
jgi:alkylated DNA repair dioxygenase AlkB